MKIASFASPAPEKAGRGVRRHQLEPAPSGQSRQDEECAHQKGFDFPYLSDSTQEVGKAYGATVTPQLFVLDRERNIAYMGKFDDDIEPEKAQRSYVRDAVHALLDGKRPDPAEHGPPVAASSTANRNRCPRH